MFTLIIADLLHTVIETLHVMFCSRSCGNNSEINLVINIQTVSINNQRLFSVFVEISLSEQSVPGLVATEQKVVLLTTLDLSDADLVSACDNHQLNQQIQNTLILHTCKIFQCPVQNPQVMLVRGSGVNRTLS